MIRPIRATDLFTIRALLRSGRGELTAPTWPKTPPENQKPGMSELVRLALLPGSPGSRIGAAVGPGGPTVGLVVAEPRASVLVWDAKHLITTGSSDLGVEMLHWVSDQALQSRGRRVFVETPSEGAGYEIASRAGFERCTEGA